MTRSTAFSAQPSYVLPGSIRSVQPGSRRVRPSPPDESLEVSVLVRPRMPLMDHAAPDAPHATREEFAERFGAGAEDLAAVAAFAEEQGLTVISRNAATRIVALSGTAQQFSAAFQVALHEYEGPWGSHRGRTGGIHVPLSLANVIEGIFGLDNRRQAKPHIVFARSRAEDASDKAAGAPTRPPGFTPLELGEIYHFPADLDGSGETIGIIEFGGGFIESDLQAYFAKLGLHAPPLKAVAIDGVGNAPTPPDARGDTPDGEVMLDIEVAGALAPGAQLVVYFAPFTERGWIDVLRNAIHDAENKPTILSISWGWSEGFDLWSLQALRAVNDAFREAAAMGISVFCASGDDGSADDQEDGYRHVDFPASSPYVTAVGGTSLAQWSRSGTEMVWNDGPGSAGGGGVSRFFPKPPYQAKLAIPIAQGGTVPGRGVPDVSANADPETGYRVRVRGKDVIVGGTSAAAPLWAALAARINQRAGKSSGFLTPILYRSGLAAHCLRDIMVGSNDTSGRLGGYPALAGWDAATGWGTPVGTALLAALTASSNEAGNSDPPECQHAARSEPEPLDDSDTAAEDELPGFGNAVARSSDGTIWAIGGLKAAGGYFVHRWNGGAWSRGEQAAVRLSAGPDDRLAIIDCNGVARLRDRGQWLVLPGLASDVSFGPEGELWGVGQFSGSRGSELAQWIDGHWHVEDGSGFRVAVMSDGRPAVLTAAGVAMIRAQSGWSALPGLFSDIEGGPHDYLLAIAQDGLAKAIAIGGNARGTVQTIAPSPVTSIAFLADELLATTRRGKIIRRKLVLEA